MKSQIPSEALNRFINASYRIVGTHSAVSVCHWTKESLRRNRVCYKEKWYGIESHRCLEMTPSLVWCTNKCQFCWRPLEFTINGEPAPDDPTNIINGCIAARKLLLMGFKGSERVDKKKFAEAIEPTSAAISLAGEPTLYPRIGELIEEFHRRKMQTFLVTNGTRPDRLKSLTTEPTNLYISLCAPNKETYKKVNRPLISNGWARLNESLELLGSFGCRTLLRLTLVNGLNFKSPEKYAKLIMHANPQFVEAKSYSWIGESRQRLPESAVVPMEKMREFANKLSTLTGYKVKDESIPSKVVLLCK